MKSIFYLLYFIFFEIFQKFFFVLNQKKIIINNEEKFLQSNKLLWEKVIDQNKIKRELEAMKLDKIEEEEEELFLV
jgi:hypothetical protein